jgi:hypothetical protein
VQEFRAGIDVRVSVRPDGGSSDSALDGAWWPRTRDLAVEIPELIAALDRRGIEIERFTYPLGAWGPAPRKIVVGGRTVRTGGFSAMDPQTVCLTTNGGARRLDLVVVPPEADALTGARALRISTRPGPRTPLLVLAAAGCPPVPQVAPLRTVRAS